MKKELKRGEPCCRMSHSPAGEKQKWRLHAGLRVQALHPSCREAQNKGFSGVFWWPGRHGDLAGALGSGQLLSALCPLETPGKYTVEATAWLQLATKSELCRQAQDWH